MIRWQSTRLLWGAIGLIAATLVGASGPAGAVPGPWQRSETREPCANFNVVRNPYFGETHLHTAHSIDAIVFNTATTPRQGYAFAKGEPLGLAPFDAEGHPAHVSSSISLQIQKELHDDC